MHLKNLYYTTLQSSLLLGLILMSWLLMPTVTHSARIYFEMQEAVVGTEGPFFVAVLLDTEEVSVNTVSVSVIVPDSLEPVDTRDSNSIISLWISKPDWDSSTRTLRFSGLIPGGFSGPNAQLITIKFIPTGSETTGTFSFNQAETSVLAHSQEAEEVPLRFENVTLPVQPGKENLPVEIVDVDPPERFTPYVVKDVKAFAGKRVVVFSTQDKGSGICCYQVAEKRGKEVSDYTKLSWRDAESPYRLLDQTLKSFVYVKALDKYGNERVIVITPQSTVSGYISVNVVGILIATVIIISGIIYARRFRSKQNAVL